MLVKDELAQIPYLLKLSQKTMVIAKQNIAASMIIKFVLGALACWVDASCGYGGFSDDGLTMLLLLNTLRLEKIRLNKRLDRFRGFSKKFVTTGNLPRKL